MERVGQGGRPTGVGRLLAWRYTSVNAHRTGVKGPRITVGSRGGIDMEVSRRWIDGRLVNVNNPGGGTPRGRTRTPSRGQLGTARTRRARPRERAALAGTAQPRAGRARRVPGGQAPAARR
ncbi:hypothetical protein KNE206_15640 [Kitasatospora sp. NE20-6]